MASLKVNDFVKFLVTTGIHRAWVFDDIEPHFFQEFIRPNHVGAIWLNFVCILFKAVKQQTSRGRADNTCSPPISKAHIRLTV